MDRQFINLEDEIREMYGGQKLENMGANNHNLWLDMYRGEYEWTLGGKPSLNLAATISSELARTATLELKSHIRGKNDDEDTNSKEDLDNQYQLLLEKIRLYVEYGLALSGIIIKPVLYGNNKITFDYATPDLFVPLEIDPLGEIKKVVFIERIIKVEKGSDVYYTRLECHDRNNQNYEITNRFFKSSDYSQLGKEITGDSISEWEDYVENLVISNGENGLDFNLYGYFKNPQANNLDLKSPLGTSCFARAVSLIQDADEQYQRIIWEYEASEMAIDVDITMIDNVLSKGNLPKHSDRLYRKLSTEDSSLYEVFSPNIRDASLFNGLNKILKKIEDTCGLSRGILSDEQEETKTATEVIKSKQRFYSTVVDIQKNIEIMLTDVVKALCFWNGEDFENVEISFDFDDSIIVDSKQETEIMLSEVAAGIIKPEYYLKVRYGATSSEIEEMLAEKEEIKFPEYDYNSVENLGEE